MARVVSEIKPHWVLGENVSGFINMGLDKTIFDLERAWYAVQAFIYSACGIGVWHQCERTFIVGVDVSHTFASDDRNIKKAKSLNVYPLDNGIFQKINSNGTKWRLPLSAAVFYLTPVASDGVHSNFPLSVIKKSKDGSNLAAQIIKQ